MCGRYGLRTDPRRFVERYLHGTVPAAYEFTPHFNIAPTQNVPAVPNTPERELTQMRWSLVPRYARDPLGSRLSTFNARIETLARSTMYAPLLETRRAIVFADGYYEWRRNPDGSKTPIWIHRRDGELILFAGLWDRWRASSTAEPLVSVTIVTKPPIEEVRAVHDRMPVVLPLENARAWLASEPLEPAAALELLSPSEPGTLVYREVSKRVGNVRNDDPSLLDAVVEVASEDEAPRLPF